MNLEAFIGNGKVVAGIVIGSLTVGAGGLSSYYAAISRLEHVAYRTEQVATMAKDAVDAARETRLASERQLREYQTATDARLEEQAQQRTVDRQDIAVMKEQLRAQGTVLERMDRRQEVLLDRLNAPRTRIVRDIP